MPTPIKNINDCYATEVTEGTEEIENQNTRLGISEMHVEFPIVADFFSQFSVFSVSSVTSVAKRIQE